MSCVLSWTSAAGQSRDTTVVISPSMSWYNGTTQMYYAVPDSAVRVILRDLIVKDKLESLYNRDSGVILTLRSECESLRETLWRDRLIGALLIIVLLFF